MRNLTQLFSVTLLALGLISCAAENPAEKPVVTSQAASVNPATKKAENQLDFYDSEVFDSKLSTALLAEQTAVEVIAVSPFTGNAIPKRIGTWVSAVNELGGSVKMQPDPAYPKSRGFIGEIIDLVMLSYDAIKQSVIYGAAEKYNLVMLYKPDGTVTKVVFQRK